MKMQSRIGKILVRAALVMGAGTLCNGSAFAQASHGSKVPAIDVAVTYQAVRSDQVSGGSFFQQGGAVELHARLFGGLGFVASVSGEHAGSQTTGAAPISFVTTVFGPRYTFAVRKRASIFLEAMGGEANAFQSNFPAAAGSSTPQTGANSLAVLSGGGVDFNLSRHLAIRAVQADWLHTQLPNGANNTQNNLRLGAGIVLKFN